MADHNSQPIKISKNKPALNFPKITKNPIFRDRGKVLFVDGKICVTRNRRHHPDQKLSRADICVRTRLPSPFSERVNPYVAPRHVIARYCAITLHLAVIQMHRGPIGETPEGQKSSTFLPDLHLPPKVDRPENSNSRWSKRNASRSPHFLFSWTPLSWNCFNNSFLSINPYRGQLIRHGWKSQLLSDYLCKTGGNPRRSIDRCLPGFIIAGHLVNFKSSGNFYKETLDYCATCALSDFVCRIRSANESQLNFT